LSIEQVFAAGRPCTCIGQLRSPGAKIMTTFNFGIA
jgi:hypothetical protein